MQSLVTDFKNLQFHEGENFINAASWRRLATYAVQMHVHYCLFYAYAIRTIACKAAWRVFVQLPPHQFRVNKRRWATFIKQATFKVARQLGKGIISIIAIMTRA